MNSGDELFRRTFTITRDDLVAYANASGDQNPIHQDDEAAKKVGLPGVIAHGMYTMGLTGRALADWAGGYDNIRDFTARFAKPVPVPPLPSYATIEVVGTVRKQLDDHLVEVNLVVTRDDEKVLAPARATVVAMNLR